MAYYKQSDSGSHNTWRTRVSNAMKRRAKESACPTCKRANALGRLHIFVEERCSVRICRYCGAERGSSF